jgi:hypothetical protein
LAKFESGGVSAAAFCRKHGLSYQTFLGWRRGAAQRPRTAESTRFVEIELQSAPAGPIAPSHKAVAELDLGQGVVLRIYPIQESRP